MRIVVKYMAQLRQAAGAASETVEIGSPSSAEEIVRRLVHAHDDAYRRLVLDAEGRVQPALLFFIGDEQVRPEMARTFRDGDVLTILAPMSGG
jgi:molybdopterin converting factor small subunit